MELEDTVEYMLSGDYQERFIAEYWQLKIRRDKLHSYIQRIELAHDYDCGDEPVHDCPLALLKDQLYYMNTLMDIMDKRRIVEEIKF